MGLTSFGFLVVIVLIGGITALLADNLGRRIGKKRLKIHPKLRPRHTATLFVVGSGLLIPIVTVTVVAAVSKDVRTWLIEGERAIQEANSLREQKKLLTSEVAGLESQIGTLQGQRDSESSRAKSAETQRTKLEREATKLNANIRDLGMRSKQATSRLILAQRNLLSAQRRYQTEVSKAIRDKKGVQTAFDELNRQIGESFAYQRQLQNNIAENERTIQEQLRLIEGASNERDALQGQIATLKTTYAADLASRENQLKKVQAELDEGERELKRVRDSILALMRMNDQTRLRPVIYAVGHEVARLVVPSDMSMSQARNMLNSLLRTARVNAEANGAKGTSRVPAAAIFDQEVDGKNVSAEQVMGQIVARIAGVPESRILVAASFWNSFQGEPVPLAVTAFPNKLCFTDGAVISEGRIEGGKSPGEIIRQLENWLAGDVRSQAIKAGMVPVAGQENSVASIEPETIFELVQQITVLSRTIRVQAIAFETTYANGPLKVVFRIR